MFKKIFSDPLLIIGFIVFIFSDPNLLFGKENSKVETNRILAAKFERRNVVQIESGDFRFKSSQIGPIHTHPAPCIGYVARGEIIYQIEGDKPQMLRTGDAFYEPTGSRILRFNNASATGKTIFIDFCVEQVGEPFIVFEKEPTEFIDRRTLTTLTLENTKHLEQVDVFEHLLQPSGHKKLTGNGSLVAGYVAEGEIELRSQGKLSLQFKAGENFYSQENHAKTFIVNVSSKSPAKVIEFNFQ